MTKSDIVAIWLSLCLTVVQWQLYKSVKSQAYVEGRMSVYNDFTAQPTDGTCYARKGCK